MGLQKSEKITTESSVILDNTDLSGANLVGVYSGGIRLPEFIVDDIYMKENKIKEIEYLDLSKIYSKKVIKDKEIKDFYEKNKNFFEEEFISFRYLELTPEILTKKQNIDEEYYEKLDKLENDILDGKKFEDLTSDNNNNINKFELINSRKTKENGTVVKNIDEILFEKIFSIKEINFPSFINFNNKFFIAEVTEKKNIVLNLQDKDLQKTISSQLKIRFIPLSFIWFARNSLHSLSNPRRNNGPLYSRFVVQPSPLKMEANSKAI